MKAKVFTAAAIMTVLVSACASSSGNDSATTVMETGTAAETKGEETKTEATEKLTGKGQGFGGVITASVTTVDGVITQVALEGNDETPGIGKAALEELEKQFAEAESADIDGVSGATVTSKGAAAAVLNALDPETNPYEEPKETESADAAPGPLAFPEDKKIVSATTYSIYTKSEASLQDAVIKATLYWNQTDNQVYDIRFLQAMLPWDDNGASGGWANITDQAVIEALGDAVISFIGNEHGNQVECNYAKYIQIGDIVWTGELGSDSAVEQAVVYTAEIDGQNVRLNDYVAGEEGGAWYHQAALNDAYMLKTADTAQADSENAAQACQITYKETNGHGEAYWMSDIKFSGNMQAIKGFVKDNGFDYGYYKDGGITQNEEGYWQTADAVSGATLDEVPTYLDILKRLYDEIQNGEYTEEN